MKLKNFFKIIIIIILILIIFDQISKIYVSSFLDNEVDLIPNNILSLKKVENKGIAFGLNKQNFVNIILSVIVLGIIIKYIINQKEKIPKLNLIYLSFIIAGGISNVLDRIFKGAVIDFIKVGDFPVFNLADIYIVCGWFLFLINFLKYTAIDIKAEMPRKKNEPK